MYIAMDCETGGIEPAYSSLLTATLQMLDDNFENVMTLELKIKHSIYLVSAEALAVNKIDLVKHHAEAIGVDEARTLMKSFLTGYEKPIPVGHNVEFDLAHVDNFYSGFRNSLSHRKLDTATIARFCRSVAKSTRRSAALKATAGCSTFRYLTTRQAETLPPLSLY